ncbi:MAG: hypothetical protein IPJ34_35690 [Myxococcales bacterium]|nr:hypothetical protein [Myxococcales bacterium]
MRSTQLLLVAFLIGCGRSALSSAAVDDAATDPAAEAATDTKAASDTSDAGVWKDTVTVLGIGQAVGTGVLGPVYPTGLFASDDQVVVVGLARADFAIASVTIPRGGFVLALDTLTGAVRWHLTIGESIGAIASVGDELAVAGSFSGTVTLPTAGAPTTLTSAGRTDGVVAVLSKRGELRWARRYGSSDFDQGFAVTSLGGAVVVAGAITGVADLGEGCGTLEARPGGDDGEGHLVGVYDAVVLRYPADGGCPWGAAIGAPLSDDMAFGVTTLDGEIFVAGAAKRPLLLRTTVGVDLELGGAPTKRPAPFLLRLEPSGKRPPATWLGLETSEGRGRSVTTRGKDLLFALTTEGGRVDRGSLPPLTLTAGAHVVAFRGTAVLGVTSLGPKTLDVGPIAVADDTALVAATEGDPGGVVFAKLGTSTSIARHPAAGATGLPLRRRDLGLEGVDRRLHGGADLARRSPVKIDTGREGGFFVARLGL